MNSILNGIQAASPDERISLLLQVKNQLIGAPTKIKSQFLTPKHVCIILSFITGEGEATENEKFQLAVQATAILGVVSQPHTQSIQILLQTKAYQVVINTLVASHNKPNHKQLFETLLRTLKLLYSDLVSVFQGRLWSSDLSFDITTHLLDFDVEAFVNTSLSEDFDTAFYRQAKDAVDSIFPSRGEPEHNEDQNTLKTFWKILVDSISNFSVQSPDVPIDTHQLRTASATCGLLATIIYNGVNRDLVLAFAQPPDDFLWGLINLTTLGNHSFQLHAFQAASAIFKDYPDTPFPTVISNWSGLDILYLAVDRTVSFTAGDLRLATLKFQALVFRLMKTNSRKLRMEHTILEITKTKKDMRSDAMFTLAYVLHKNTKFQQIIMKEFSAFQTILEEQNEERDPLYSGSSSLKDQNKVIEGILLVLATLAMESKQSQQLIVGPKVLPLIVAALDNPSDGVRVAACHCIRGISRSTNILRTALQDVSAAVPLVNLLSRKEHPVVQLTSLMAVTNLVLDFSPMRQTLIEAGVVDRLCHLAKNDNGTLKKQALWALKNALYQTQSMFKITTMESLGWDYLTQLINYSPDAVCEQALGVLKNVVHTFNDEPISGLSEMGEGVLLSCLEKHLRGDNNVLVKDSLDILINVATVNEEARLAIVHRPTLLYRVIYYLDHEDEEIRAAGLWVLTNLTFRENCVFGRVQRSDEIMEKLQALGVQRRVEKMRGDSCHIVRDRAVEVLQAIRNAGYDEENDE